MVSNKIIAVLAASSLLRS